MGGIDKIAPSSEARARIERALLGTFFAVRLVHLAQGVICILTGRRAYRRTWLATSLLAASTVETGWILRRSLRLGTIDATCARVDAAFSAAGVGAMALATNPADRTASLNWMLPYSVGSTLAGAAGLRRNDGAIATSVLASLYGMSVLPATRGTDGSRAPALANMLSYPGFFAVGGTAIALARRTATEVDASRQREIEDATRLSAAQERNRQHRLLHDSALQTLEAVAAGWTDDTGTIRARAKVEAARLRAALRGDDEALEGHLMARLHGLVEDFGASGLSIELVYEVDGEPGTAEALALCDAAREALVNVTKHADVAKAVVRASNRDEGVELTVRDQGRGFDPSDVVMGFGIAESITTRVLEAGGRAEIWSRPGRGTRVTLWVPR